MKRAYRVLALSMLAFSLPAVACINDRDSDKLEKEVEAGKPGLPDVMRVVTGRFERNPPLFYEMRLKRSATLLSANPDRLDLYDDVAAAADRLHRDDEAIAWMEKKRARLEKQKPFAQVSTQSESDKKLREAWYRYYANTGTFVAHRWLQNGADRTKISEMKRAASMIETAIKIKPNAHFGREKYQLMAMKWIINPPKGWTSTEPLPTFLGFHIRRTGLSISPGIPQPIIDPLIAKDELKKRKIEDAVEGISGLIVLGAAWESVDVFNALRVALDAESKGSVSEFTKLRLKELIDSDKRSQFPQNLTREDLYQSVAQPYELKIRSYTPQQMQEIYSKLRKEADEYHQKRTDYMMARLEKGQHPDTNPDFWNEWRDAGPPAPVPYTFWEKRGTPITIIAAALLLSLGTLTVKRRKNRV